MPEAKDRTARDRVLGTRTNTHPRANGDMILTPDDILEGIGDFVHVDPSGDPAGMDLGRVEMPNGRHVYVGTTPDGVVRQTTRYLPYERATHRVDYVLADTGARPPNASTPAPLVAQIPRPASPRLIASASTTTGFPASTPTSPHWFAWGYYVNGKVAGYTPPVAFQIAYGQSVRVPLPLLSSLPQGVYHVALLMSVPGTSRVDGPGPMYVQRILDLRSVRSTTYELTGPYRREGFSISSSDSTVLPTAPAPILRRLAGPYSARVGQYQAMITWADANGETMAGATTSYSVTIVQSPRYTIYGPPEEEGGPPTVEFIAGEGLISITRPAAPPNATGWRCYLYITPTTPNLGYSVGWRKVIDKQQGRGDVLPFGMWQTTILTTGWEGTEGNFTENDYVVCVDTDLPEANTTGFGTPEDQPEVPIAFGASRPLPGRYYVKVTDVVNGVESLPSNAAAIDIASNEVFSVLFRDQENVIFNGAFSETDNNSDPQNWTIVRTGGYASPGETGEDYLIGTTVATAGTTPTATSEWVPIDKTKQYYLNVRHALETPLNGPVAGTVEVVRRTLLTTGSTVESIVHSATLQGEVETAIILSPTGGGGTFPWNADASQVQFQYRFTGASKNHRVRLKYLSLRDKKPRPRTKRQRLGAPYLPLPEEYPRVEDPPKSIVPPETQVVPAPDRPLSTGTTLQTLDYEGTNPPTGFTSQTAGGALLTFAATAALGGALGQRTRKTASGAGAFAFTQKTFAADTGYTSRHGLGLHMKNRLSVQPTSGWVRMHNLCRPSDGTAFAWLEFSNAAEVQSLTITGQPLTTGNVGVNLAGTNTNVSVLGAHEVKQVNVTGAPTAPGTITITLDNTPHYVQASGGLHQWTAKVLNTASVSGYIRLSITGESEYIYVTPSMTKTQIAAAIAAEPVGPYNGVASGDTATFTAWEPGPRTTPTFSNEGTGVSVTVTQTDAGTAETATQLATRIRATSFAGWITGGSGTSITFTSDAAGPRSQISTSAGSSGATLTTATNTAGSIDSPTDLATRIRGTTFTGWTTGGTGTNVTFTATAAGVKAPSSYTPNATGAVGTMTTTLKGSAGTLLATVKDALNVTSQRQIMTGLLTTDVFNTDITVSGAGTNRAVISFWGSTSTNPLTLLARFEDVDLTGYPAGLVKVGVTSDSASAVLWELHSDEGSVTDLGKSYYRDHNALGEWLPQVYYYAREGQPARQDLLLQGAQAAVIPAGVYTLSLYARAIITTANGVLARLLTISAHPDFAIDGPIVAGTNEVAGGSATPDTGVVEYLGDVTNTTGLTGESGWTHYQKTVTIPDGCHAISLSSKDIGSGEIVIQEAVLSEGSVPKRTRLYATSGTYNRIFAIDTPYAKPHTRFWDRERIDLGAISHAPTGTSVTLTFRSAHPLSSDPSIPDGATWSTYVSDPATVPDRLFLQINFAMTSSTGGLLTPTVSANSPRAEYLLTLGDRRMSTLLKGDRSELPGGVAFAKLDEWHRGSSEGRRLLPSGRLHDDPQLFAPVGQFPEAEIFIFDDQARRILEENWKDTYVAELYGNWALTLKFSAKPTFAREAAVVLMDNTSASRRSSVWRGTLPPAEVVEAIEIPPTDV